MKKKVIALMLAFAMVFALAACGSKDAGESAADLSSMSWYEIVDQAK